MSLCNSLGRASRTQHSFTSEHLRDLRSLHFRTQVPAQSLQMNSNDLIPLSVVLRSVNVVDVRLEPVTGCLINQLILVRRRNYYDTILRTNLAQFCLDLGKNLVASRI